jgi:uncharacterized protein with von Willebrand factor type A (vWA) domain
MSDIIIVLDKSGSMNALCNEPIQAMNNFILEQKRLNENGRITLYPFSSNVRKVIDNQPLSSFAHYSDYRPCDRTALYDAIGRAITEKQATQKHVGVVLVIITDGADNSSRLFNRDKVRILIKEQELLYNWQILYLGGKDSLKNGQDINVSQNNCVNFFCI